MKTRTSGIIAALLLAGSGTTLLADGDGMHQAAIDFRSSNMLIYKWYMGPMGAMVKGKVPYDQAAFQKNAAGLATAASLDLLAGFPQGSTDPDSEAKAEIWQDWSGFSDRFEALQRESAKLAEIAASADAQASMEQFKKTGGTCKGCHDDFREK